VKTTNKLNLPEGFVKAVSTERHNKPGCLSATTLIQGIKQIILTDRHWEKLEEDVSDRVPAILGTAVHSLMESKGEHDLTELKIEYPVGSITVTGTIDNYNMTLSVLTDYKTTSVEKIKFGNFTDWYLQGMIYAWLLIKNNLPVNKCRFIALLKDHSKTEAMRDYQYPKEPVYVYEFDVTPQALFKISMYIKNKVEEHQRYSALDDHSIPPCSPEERWDQPTEYAVKKNGSKRATKLFESLDEAILFAESKGKGYFVEHRPGESRRCQSYCLCNRFCNYYRESVITRKAEPIDLQTAA
jgi:hypothetical protein